MIVLVLNCGSSTLKFQIVETSPEQMEKDQDRRLARGSVERIGGQALLQLEVLGSAVHRETCPLRDHRQAIDRVVAWFRSIDAALPPVNAIGHRVVHGGEHFKASVRIDDTVLRGIEDCISLAPLHNPANLRGIRAAQELFGKDMPQVAVFDTAFHANMPEKAYLYGIPYQLYRRHRIRRYGFHGTSHRYVAYRYRKLRQIPKEQVRIISLHLGNGCSACAIEAGSSVDTSMGMTPLEGLLMGTRCGDLDPSIVDYLIMAEGLSPSEADSLLNKQSGLLGLSGLTGDMRDLLSEWSETRDRRAGLAIDVFCQRVKKYIGSYLAVLGGADAVIFTGGIGQNSAEIRQQVCQGLQCFGIQLDPSANQQTRGDVLCQIGQGSLPVFVIPTDEELLIARDTVRCSGGSHSH